MNAIELFHKDGKSAGIFYCDKCRRVAKDRNFAEQCCAPYKCADCDCDVPREKHRSLCDDCHCQRKVKRIAELLEQATEVTDYDGWVYVDHFGHNDGYFYSVDDLLEYCECEGIEPPEFAFCCKERKFEVDPQRVIEYAEQRIEIDCCEDYEPKYSGMKEFAEACQDFTEANRHVCTYWEDTQRKVRIRESEAPE